MWQQWAIFFPKKTFVLVARTFVFVLARLRVLPGKKNSLVMIMSYESLPMSCPGNTRTKSLKPMKYDIYSSRMFKLCYSHLAVGGKREGGAKKGIASVHTHFQRVLGVHELQKHHQKLVLILRRPHLIPATTFRSRI